MSTADTLNFMSQKVQIYFGLFILIVGVTGGILNIIIFTTLKTFREATSGFYLATVSIVNIGQLVIGLLIRILSEGFSIDIRSTSVGCKIQVYTTTWFSLTSLTIVCFATIDQYVSMSPYRRFSNKQLAQRATIVTCILWAIYSISHSIYYDAPSGTCMIINPNFAIFATRVHFPVLLGFLPLSTMTLFSLLAFNSARTLVSRQINIVRLNRDRQLTAMTLVHAIFVVTTSLPFIIFFIYALSYTFTNAEQVARKNLNYTITLLIYYSSYAGSFYIYCCVSERFRKQLVYVLMKICTDRREGNNNLNNNQIMPSMEKPDDIQPTYTKQAVAAIVSIP